jgi:endo-1,4-beta-D-glucanase Y
MKKITGLSIVCILVILIVIVYVSMADDSSATTNTLSEETVDFYEKWKNEYVIKNSYITNEDQYYVWYSGETYSQNNSATAVTVSEAHGYGMLITVSMADYDKDAKSIFDGMYRYYRAHLSSIGPNLMAWQQEDNGSAIVDTTGSDSATDGDMDIAYALLMADSIWGSDGEIPYKQTAIDIINDIMTYEVNKTDWIMQLGDWVYSSKEGDEYYSATRSSDFILQYMPVFAKITGDERWLKVYESTYNIINSITDEYNVGILPDFIVKDDDSGAFVPASPNYLESEYDGAYYYNSCRTPWRISMDYLINGNEDALAFAEMLNGFILDSTDGEPQRIRAGYKLDGTPIENYEELCFTAPFMIAAACGTNQEWHDSIRNAVINYGDDVYYGDSIKMLCLIVDDGGWIVPEDK